jgi:hypothetical protein
MKCLINMVWAFEEYEPKKINIKYRIADINRENIIVNADTNENDIIKNRNENYMPNGWKLNEINRDINIIKMRADIIASVLTNLILVES